MLRYSLTVPQHLEEDDEKVLNLKNFCNLTENEKKGINNLLSKDLYENELKFKRPSSEVECITDGVKTIVEQLMTAVCDKEPLLEISHQHLVGSMAEGTSIHEPDEYDFIVVLRHFSEPGAISIHEYEYMKSIQNRETAGSYYVCNENIDSSLRESDYVCYNEDRKVKFKDYYMSTILKDIISSIPEPLYVETDHGRLTINSTTVCHHGPASVVKLLWKPKSESSATLDILIDITPCIEEKGIDKIEKSKDIPDGYKYCIFNDDTFMLIPVLLYSKHGCTKAAITTTEVKIVNTLSSHHKTCYMILKYCLNSIIHRQQLYNNLTLFPSYIIKMFLLQHVLRCESGEKGHHDTEECLFTCLLDIMSDIKKSNYYADGIFGYVEMPTRMKSGMGLSEFIDNVIDRLCQIGKEGYSVDRHEDFRKSCHRTSIHSAILKRADRLARKNVKCQLSLNCKIHILVEYASDSSDSDSD